MELIILFSPLLGAIIGGFFWRSIGESQAIYLTIALLFLSCFLSWIVFLSHDAHVEKITLFRWINSGDLSANWSIRLDRLTSIMLVVVTSVSALVHLYSVGYMAQDELQFFISALHDGEIAGNTQLALMKVTFNRDGKFDFNEMVSLNSQYPAILFPAFRLQASMMNSILGERWWLGKKNMLAFLKEEELMRN